VTDRFSPEFYLESLSDRGNVEFEESTDEVDRETFERVRERAATKAGTVVVGVTRKHGDVFLVTLEGGHGWKLPFDSVGVDQSWTDAATRCITNLVGLETTANGILRVRRKHHQCGSDSVTTHDVLVHASISDGESELGNPREPATAADWFDSPPTNLWDHADAEADVRLAFNIT